MNKGDRPGPLDSLTSAGERETRAPPPLQPEEPPEAPRGCEGHRAGVQSQVGANRPGGTAGGRQQGRGPQAGQGCGSGSEDHQATGGGRPDRGPTSTLLPCGLLPSGAEKPGGRPTEGSHPHSWDLGLFGARPLQPGVHHHPARPLPSPGHPPTARVPLGLLHRGTQSAGSGRPVESSARPSEPSCPETGRGCTARGQPCRKHRGTVPSRATSGCVAVDGSHPFSEPCCPVWALG